MPVYAIRRKDENGKRRRGKGWLIDIRTREGRIRVRSPGATREDAQAHEAYLRGELAKHGTLRHAMERLPSPVAVPTFAEFAERWARECVDVNNKPSERRKRRSILRAHLVPVLGSHRIDAIDIGHIQRLKLHLQLRRSSPKTVNNVLGVLRVCLKYARGLKLILELPELKEVRAREPDIHFLESEEVDALARAMNDRMWSALVVIAAKTGLRFGELAGLEWRDVTLDGDTPRLHVVRGYVEGELATTKTDTERTVPLCRSAVETLRGLERRGDAVFMYQGERLKYPRAHKRLTRACRRAGVRHVGWHVFRHTFASQLVLRGVNPKAIQKLLGHTTLEMTFRYLRLRDGGLAEAVAVLDHADHAPRSTRSHHGVTTVERAAPRERKERSVERSSPGAGRGSRTPSGADAA